MNSTKSTTKWLAITVGMQAIVLAVLLGGGPSVAPARAEGIPDEGAQRERMIDQLKAVNANLDRLFGLLSGGNLEVKVKKTDDAKAR